MSFDWVLHPGEIIKEHLEELGVSSEDFQKSTGVSSDTLNQVLDGSKEITPHMAEALEMYFGCPEAFWLKLQENYEEDCKRLYKQNNKVS